MAGEQLERSILESKERDELQAIAAAMSLKPAARTKKSDIIDLILDATGIAANEDEGARIQTIERAPPEFESYGRGDDARMEAERGADSRGSMSSGSRGEGGAPRGGGGGRR